MQLTAPIIITPRLMAGVQIGSDFVSIEYGAITSSGRMSYRYYLDVDGKEYTGTDLKSGVGNWSIQDGLESLLSFLSAAAESYHYNGNSMKEDSNTDLFPEWVCQWAYQHSDEIDMLALELQEKELVTE